jgi:hypothetical protein
MVGAGLKVYFYRRFTSLWSRETRASGNLIWNHPGPRSAGGRRQSLFLEKGQWNQAIAQVEETSGPKPDHSTRALIVLGTAYRTRRPFFVWSSRPNLLQERCWPLCIYSGFMIYSLRVEDR